MRVLLVQFVGQSLSGKCKILFLSSLVVVGESGVSVSPLSKSCPDDRVYDVVVWMDHRAMAEADEINRLAGEAMLEIDFSW